MFLVRKKDSGTVMFRTPDEATAQEMIRFYQDNTTVEVEYDVIEVTERQNRQNGEAMLFVVNVGGSLTDGTVNTNNIMPLPADKFEEAIHLVLWTTDESWHVEGRMRGRTLAEVQTKVQNLVSDQIGVRVRFPTSTSQHNKAAV